MNDSEFVQALQEIFDANDPSDGIDRADGYGRDHRIESVRVVESEDGFDDLEVTVRADRKIITARLLFDAEWRRASALDQVEAYAVYVAAMWSRVSELRPTPVGSVGEVEDLEVVLRRAHATVSRVAPDVLTVVDDEGEPFTVHASAQQWQEFVAGHGEAAARELEATIGSRWDDEQHIVFFRGIFHWSIRAQVPPVRSMLLRDSGGASAGSARPSER